MTKKGATVYVDADACPHKETIDTWGAGKSMQIVFVASSAHASNKVYEAETVMVENEPEAADMYIWNHVSAGDLVIADDHGLAAIALEKGAAVLSFRGKRWKKGDEEWLLAGRYAGVLAKQGKHRVKGPKAISLEERKLFFEGLEIFEAGGSESKW
ncbi:hypothetical protein SAMN05421781_0982 [Marinococcus luteus]|uniref:Uncharacterized protein n=1 Tax=Marinococcus luteus TaxID=1122204 RepID=A0A1H2S0D1_9BACI|nr:DUF188 domain-containing protein [Marinococcus luteus]SDW25017.1 hypothetical protein SAMN05421781_0982 [Marinococcus luteus]